MSEPTNLRLEEQLCFALYAATNAITRAYRPLLGSLGLTYPQYLVLLVLWQDGAQTIQAVANRLRLGSNAITPLIDRLAEAGLVVRGRSSADRRVVHVALTPAGFDLRAAASAAQEHVSCQTGLDLAALVRLRADLAEMTACMEPAAR